MNYWWLVVNPKKGFKFSDIDVGVEESFGLRTNSGKIKPRFRDARVGDLVIGYESSPRQQIVAFCRIAKEIDRNNLDSDENGLYVEKIEDLQTPLNFNQFIKLSELQNMDFIRRNFLGTLFKLTENEYTVLKNLINKYQHSQPNLFQPEIYDKKLFLEEVYMDEEDYDGLLRLLKTKKNIILQGPPGTGKTHVAKRLAYSMMEKKDNSRVKVVQFHQSYSYEDFIMGYRPNPQGDGFSLKDGVFYEFCEAAGNNYEREPYFFIIDEINRGNISKIFGEVLMLIENNYRGEEINLAFGDGYTLSVPENLYIIGMMNTADRSLSQIDYALRRRFSFFPMSPAFENEIFKAYQKSLNSEKLDKLIKIVRKLNENISADNSLGEGCCIGHSYFCNQKECSDGWLESVVKYELIPVIREYWFDEKSKFEEWEKELISALK